MNETGEKKSSTTGNAQGGTARHGVTVWDVTEVRDYVRAVEEEIATLRHRVTALEAECADRRAKHDAANARADEAHEQRRLAEDQLQAFVAESLRALNKEADHHVAK